jgi:hypothetical protein
MGPPGGTTEVVPFTKTLSGGTTEVVAFTKTFKASALYKRRIGIQGCMYSRNPAQAPITQLLQLQRPLS